eukprot:GHRQ01017282.1.p2 GENE.GHRQ01017282.1~~GHRQ01017282.1.p2  ORF type:complete len:110 (+),score=3.34 GHRQ01017282.1:1715-2044(+)
MQGHSKYPTPTTPCSRAILAPAGLLHAGTCCSQAIWPCLVSSSPVPVLWFTAAVALGIVVARYRASSAWVQWSLRCTPRMQCTHVNMFGVRHAAALHPPGTAMACVRRW